jgi:hypothetical protein
MTHNSVLQLMFPESLVLSVAFQRFLPGKKVHCIFLALRIQAVELDRTHRLDHLQITLFYKPGDCRIGLWEAVMQLFLQQAPARNSFKRVCCLRIAHEIAEHLLCEFWFSIDA